MTDPEPELLDEDAAIHLHSSTIDSRTKALENTSALLFVLYIITLCILSLDWISVFLWKLVRFGSQQLINFNKLTR